MQSNVYFKLSDGCIFDETIHMNALDRKRTFRKLRNTCGSKQLNSIVDLLSPWGAKGIADPLSLKSPKNMGTFLAYRNNLTKTLSIREENK